MRSTGRGSQGSELVAPTAGRVGAQYGVVATIRWMGRWLLPVIAVMVIAADAILYAWLLAQQDGTGPSMTWFLVGMAAAALLAIYGAIPGIPLRRTALVVAGAGLLVLGVLGLASVGAPLLVAAALCWIAGTSSGAEPAG